MIRNYFLVVIIVNIVISCVPEKEKASEEIPSESMLVTDDLGRTMELKEVPRRVISLAPSLTEIIYFIGAESQLACRTQVCDYPEDVLDLPVVSTYPLDIETIVKNKPDLVISVDGIINLDQVAKLEELGVKVFFTKYKTIDDINKNIVVIGNLLGKGQRASFLVDSLNQELNKIKVSTTTPLKVLNITWPKPIYIYGYDTPFTDKIAFAGGKNAVGEILNSPYPEVSREYILKLNPDVIVGSTLEKLDSTLFTYYPELKTINAYKKRQIYNDVTDNLMSRPSPRYVESIKELKAILNKCE